MLSKMIRLALGAAAVVCLGGASSCVPEMATGPGYQAPVVQVAPPANLAQVCYTDADLQTMHARMVQQELATAVLGCKDQGGNRLYTNEYTNFIGKYQADLKTNYVALDDVARRKRLNIDEVVTQMANRTAGRATEPDFCPRIAKAFNWALSANATTLATVPPPYDFAAEMYMFRCPRG